MTNQIAGSAAVKRSGFVVLIAVLTVGCGGSKSAGVPSPTTSTTVTTSAAAALAHEQTAGPAPAGAIEVPMRQGQYVPSDISAPSGRVVLHLVNQDTATASKHDIKFVDDLGHDLASSDYIAPGADAVFILDAVPPGTYKFICTLHAGVGMKGTLTVT